MKTIGEPFNLTIGGKERTSIQLDEHRYAVIKNRFEFCVVNLNKETGEYKIEHDGLVGGIMFRSFDDFKWAVQHYEIPVL